jgi:hypothetical protein
MRRGSILLIAVIIAITVGLVGFSQLVARPVPTQAATTGSPGPAPSLAAPSPAGIPTSAGYTDGSFGADVHDPTAGPGQSKIWFADGTWWAAMIAADGHELHVAKLDPTTQRWHDTGTLIDDRPHVSADALWDGTSLWVASADPRPDSAAGLRVARFRLDAKAHAFILEPDFPVVLTARGVVDPTLARDTTGRLWVAYLAGDKPQVRHALATPWTWSGSILPATMGSVASRLVALDARGGRVAAVIVPTTADTLQVAIHEDGAADNAWQTAQTTIGGIGSATGGASIRLVGNGSDWRLLTAIETTAAGAAASLAPGSIVATLFPDGHWATVQLARQKDHFGRPTLTVDPTTNTVYVFATTSNGQLVYKRSQVDLLSFDSGTGDVLAGDGTTSAIRNPSVAKSDASLAGGILVLAGDATSTNYVHAVLLPPTATPVVQGPATAVPIPRGILVVDDTFDPVPVGTRPGVWDVEPQGLGKGNAVVVAGATAADHALRVAASSAVGAVRSCRTVPTTAADLSISYLVRLDAIGGSDAKLASVRGPGGEAVAIRVDRHARFAWYNGTAKITGTRTIVLHAWYRLSITVHFATRRYDWVLTTTKGTRLVVARGLRWRTPTVAAINSVCVETPNNAPRAAIWVDGLVVRR